MEEVSRRNLPRNQTRNSFLQANFPIAKNLFHITSLKAFSTNFQSKNVSLFPVLIKYTSKEACDYLAPQIFIFHVDK